VSVRDVGVIAFAQETVEKDRERNEVEFIIPVVQEAVRQSGMGRHDIDFTISGSCDYLSGGPFTFVAGLDGAGAWPPVRESHVEMDAAWALYEAWVAIQTGEIDSALIYGFGKSSLADDVYQTFTLQADPYTVTPLWPSLIHFAGLQASALLHSGRATERDFAEIAARSARDAMDNPHAIRKEDVDADALLARPLTHAPLREADIFPVTDGSCAMVIAAEDVARDHCERPAWIRGIDHRIDAPHIGVRDLTTSESTRRSGEEAGAMQGGFDIAELHAQYSSDEIIVREALGLDASTRLNPSGGALGANPLMASGLIRIGEVASRIRSGEVGRGLAHATQGPCLQQNLVCVLEGE
jgi:acetyl-CoA acetyltransferase